MPTAQEQALEAFTSSLMDLMTTAHDAGLSGATLGRAAALTFEGLFAGQLAEDPNNTLYLKATQAEANVAAILLQCVQGGI